MKNIKSALVAGLLSATVMVSGAMAGTVGIQTFGSIAVPTTYSGERTIAAESLGSTYLVDMSVGTTPSNPTPVGVANFVADVVYIPGYGINPNDRFQFTFTNGAYASTTAYLVMNEAEYLADHPTTPAAADLNHNGTLDVIPVATLVSSLAANSKVVELRVISNDIIMPSDVKLHLVKAVPTDVGPVAFALQNPSIRVDANLAAGSLVQVKVDAFEGTGSITAPIPAGAAGNATIFDIQNQFGVAVTKATSYIDIPARKAFIPEGGGDVILTTNDTQANASAGLFHFLNNADATKFVEDAIPTTKIASIALKLTCNKAFDVEDFANHNVYLDWAPVAVTTGTAAIGGFEFANGTFDNGNEEFILDASGNFAVATIPTLHIPPIAGDWSDDIYIGVNTTTNLLSLKEFQVSPTFKMVDPTTSVTYKAPVVSGQQFDSHSWLINGGQFIIPNMQSVMLTLTNNSSMPADVQIDVVTDAPKYMGSGAQTTANGIALGTIPPYTAVKFTADDIKAKVAAAFPAGYEFADFWGRVIVVAPKNSVFASAVRTRNANGIMVFTTIPALTDGAYEQKQ